MLPLFILLDRPRLGDNLLVALRGGNGASNGLADMLFKFCLGRSARLQKFQDGHLTAITHFSSEISGYSSEISLCRFSVGTCSESRRSVGFAAHQLPKLLCGVDARKRCVRHRHLEEAAEWRPAFGNV
jgi:hypothetical protein